MSDRFFQTSHLVYSRQRHGHATACAYRPAPRSTPCGNNVSATIRYQISLFPLVLILGGISLAEFFDSDALKKYINPLLILPVLILALIFSLNSIKPFYFGYASRLLPKKYVLNPKDMGEGSYEAAMYLNSLPSPEKISVWSDTDGVCDFFLGICDTERDPEKIDNFNYFVVSSGRQSRTTRLIQERMERGKVYSFRIDKLYLNNDDQDFNLEIGGRPNNYVKVFPASSVEKK